MAAREITLHYRGLTVRLEEDDARIQIIDYLLFRDLPPPLERPVEPEPVAAPEPAPVEPAVEVPDVWHRFWELLPDRGRHLLGELCHRQLTTPELEALLGMAPGTTRGLTIAIAQNAKKLGLDNPIRGNGFGRLKRRHYVGHEAAELIRELERRWLKVETALAEARRGALHPARRSIASG